MLQVGDELLEINGNSTEGMLHSDAITIIKHGGNMVKLIVRRLPDESFVGCKWCVCWTVCWTVSVCLYPSQGKWWDVLLSLSPLAGQDQGTVLSPTAASTKDRYAQDYMNSLKRSNAGQFSPPPHE